MYKYVIRASNYPSKGPKWQNVTTIEQSDTNYAKVVDAMHKLAKSVFSKKDIVEFSVLQRNYKTDECVAIKYFRYHPMPRTIAEFKKAPVDDWNSKNRVKVGDKIKIVALVPNRADGKPDPAEKKYTGKIGIVTDIDDKGHIAGTWGGIRLLPEDLYKIVKKRVSK